jgi:hypothetical protein
VDGREIIENITGFFSILQEWDRQERTDERGTRPLLPLSKIGERDRRRKAVETESSPSLDQESAEKQA